MSEKNTKKFFIIAGEASGDVLGGKLIAEIKSQFHGKENLEFIGVGGANMQAQGLKSIFDMNELSIMGFVEVVPHIAKLMGRINQTAQSARESKPDYIITIDSPDFNFRVLEKLKNYKEAKKIHLIAPSVWAYREKRAKKIAALYDLLLVILPFEPPYFSKYNLKTVFIGHPIIENVPDFTTKQVESEAFRKKHGFYHDDTLLYVTPGSRIGEVKKIFPHFIEAINALKPRLKNLSVVIPAVAKTKHIIEKLALDLDVKYVIVDANGEHAEKHEALLASDCALAKSGTNTLEASIYQLPMVVCYKVNFVTYVMAKILLRIRFANLVNLILEREVIPELIQQKCTAKEIVDTLERLIKDKTLAQKQISESKIALKVLGLESLSPTKKAVVEILSL